MNLAANMADAWLDQMTKALWILEAAWKAPALFRPDTVEQARRDFAHAQHETRRWRS